MRELIHVVERATILTHGRQIRFTGLEPPIESRLDEESPSILPLVNVEKAHIERALEATRWRVSGPRGAANLLGISRYTLRYRMQKLGISSHPG